MLVVPNFAQTTLRSAITPSSTSLALASGGGAYFAIGVDNYVYLTLLDGASVEVVKFTNSGIIVNDTLTGIERGQDNTTAKSFPAGTCVKVAWNVAQIQDLVTQTFIDLFNASVIPPNTVVVNVSPPNAAPPANVIYAINTSQHQFWYWNGISWIEIGNARAGVLAGSGDPSGTPDNVVAFYVNVDNGQLWYWTGSVWMLIAGGAGSTEEYWVRSALGNDLYILPPDTQIELGAITVTDRYRTYPNGVAANTILETQIHGGQPRTTLLQDAAMEVLISVRGDFGSDPVPDAIMELVISNSYDSELFGNASPVNPSFSPDIVLQASTGVLTWPAGTYFDGNLVYSESGAGPWANFHVNQLSYEFHVIEAGVGP